MGYALSRVIGASLIVIGASIYSSSASQSYITSLTAFQGSIGCLARLKGPVAGPQLLILVSLKDPNGTTIRSEEDWTYSTNLEVEFAVEPTVSGVYTCSARYDVDGTTIDNLIDTDQIFTTPTGETTTSAGWGSGQWATVHDWNQALLPSNDNFVGRYVWEEDPGGGGPDTCYFTGSAMDPFEAVTTPGLLWEVQSGNTWGPDRVGYHADTVSYYRTHDRTPCGTTFPQDMHINPLSTSIKYRTNTLKAGMTETTVWSQRDGKYAQRIWP